MSYVTSCTTHVAGLVHSSLSNLVLQRREAFSTSLPCLETEFVVAAITRTWSCISPVGSNVHLIEKVLAAKCGCISVSFLA
ncbi:hypothetical protein H9L39_01946 [Fusarium oxysporum f. sp. albedinis]|nr:hypothetical protein H9L39_01946 [Fusarium oxysporum f. sp. albedinis]